ncbi:hypothetical protein H257_03243 [Aphanomyces astaci]|nr:hypothetical protein H257_03243 [Aphanomyces astaci]ETV85530.1 hypothetical protein H257_03243 [Aphanomyces astaci]|eukprot:XP_009825548.1 hypothetical protein H257_03243 [Aphanomyces astaci]
MGAQSTRMYGQRHSTRRGCVADATATSSSTDSHKRKALDTSVADNDGTHSSSFLHIRYPCESSTWIRGSPVCIEWTVLDPTIQNVRIELCQHGSSVSTLLTPSVPNSGCFVLERVPWGVLGDGFYIRVIEDFTSSSSSRPLRCAQSHKFCVATTRWRYHHLTSTTKPSASPTSATVRIP